MTTTDSVIGVSKQARILSVGICIYPLFWELPATCARIRLFCSVDLEGLRYLGHSWIRLLNSSCRSCIYGFTDTQALSEDRPVYLLIVNA